MFIRHGYLKNPIKQTEEMPVGAFLKYAKAAENQPDMPTKETAARISEIRDIFWSSHDGVSDEVLENHWNFMFRRLLRNDGLAQFTLDYNGAKSDYFFPWLEVIQSSPSAALEMAYNAGRDLYGIWTDQIPEDDPISYFVKNDPTFVYNRERQLYMADLMSAVQDIAFIKGSSKVVDLGAGQMAWLRHHNYRPSPGYQEIYAFDIDKSIDIDRQYGLTETIGVVYEHKNFIEALTGLEMREIDAITMGGLASYLPITVMKNKVLPRVYELLVSGGVFFFDLQLDCPYYRRSVAVFDWPKIKLMDSVVSAVQQVETIRKKLWWNGMKFGAEYTLDTYNEVPTSVMVLLTKV